MARPKISPELAKMMLRREKAQKKKESDALARARAKYDAENTLRIGLKLNRKTDADIIDHLRSIPPASGGSGGVQGYIKELIRTDVHTKNAHGAPKQHK